MRTITKTLSFLLFFAGAQGAQALPGIDGIRWQTVYNVLGGGTANADVEIDASGGAIFPSGDADADGDLTITSAQTDPTTGLVTSFKGTWDRGGDGGDFFFNVIYVNGQATRLIGGYRSQESGNIYLNWSSLP